MGAYVVLAALPRQASWPSLAILIVANLAIGFTWGAMSIGGTTWEVSRIGAGLVVTLAYDGASNGAVGRRPADRRLGGFGAAALGVLALLVKAYAPGHIGVRLALTLRQNPPYCFSSG